MIPEDVHNLCTERIWPLAKAASRLFELVTAGTSLLFFFPTLPPWEKSLWCWSGMTQQLRSRTSEKLGFLNMLGASESTEVISFCILGYVCDGSCTGSAHGYRGMIAAVWYGNDAVLCFYVDMTMHLDLTLSGWNLKFEKQSHTLLEYVIGGGTGELPPQRYEVSVLGLWLVDGQQVTCLVYVICYLVGVSFCTYSTSSLALCCISSQIISAGLWEWHCYYRSSVVWWLVAYTFTSQWNGPRTTNDWARVDEIEKAIPTRTPSQAGRVKNVEESWGVNEVWVRDHAMLSAPKI